VPRVTDTPELPYSRAVEALRLILRYAHLIGFALLLGGAIMQYLSGRIRINPAMLWGSIIQVVTGLVLAAPLRGGGDDEPDPAKLAVKGLIAVLIFIMVFFSRKRDEVNRGHFLAIVGMTLVNAAVATFWR
jgi:ABC-type cobalamin transport system permease subunit